MEWNPAPLRCGQSGRLCSDWNALQPEAPHILMLTNRLPLGQWVGSGRQAARRTAVAHVLLWIQHCLKGSPQKKSASLKLIWPLFVFIYLFFVCLFFCSLHPRLIHKTAFYEIARLCEGAQLQPPVCVCVHFTFFTNYWHLPPFAVS